MGNTLTATTATNVVMLTLRVVGHEFASLTTADDHARSCRSLGLRAWAKSGIVAVVVETYEDESLVRMMAQVAGGFATGD